MDAQAKPNLLIQIHTKKERDRIRKEKARVIARIRAGDEEAIAAAQRSVGRRFMEIAERSLSLAEGLKDVGAPQIPTEVLEEILDLTIRATALAWVTLSDDVAGK